MLVPALLPLTLAVPHAAAWSLSSNIVGSGFLNSFSHQAISDPTHGRVNYVSQSTALAQNLTYANGNTFVMRADHTSTLSASGPGRNSVRIQSNAQYTTSLLVLDLRHMPTGCATWPAFWTVGNNWPNNGEIDIIEGVNGKGANQATLHTSPGCTMGYGSQSGNAVSTNCDTSVNGNQGCGVTVNKANSFADSFNSAGGGWYAMERTNDFIKIWYWSRNDGSAPSDMKNGAQTVDSGSWGQPFATFDNSGSCNLSQKFGPHNIVFDLTLCGDWAGSVFTSQGCGSDCATFVNQNPSAFTNAYWDIAALRIYQ